MAAKTRSVAARIRIMARPAPAVLAGLAFLLPGSHAATAQSPAPQSPAERVRAQYPTMPEPFVAELAAQGGIVTDDASCTLLDWIVRPDSGAQDRQREIATDRLRSCRVPADDMTEAAATAMLGGEKLAAKLDGNLVTIVARTSEDELRLCCSLQSRMERIGTSDLWRARVRLADPEHAIISLMIGRGPTGPDATVSLRGPLAPAAPAQVFMTPLRGQLLIDRPFDSTALGEKRRLAIYLPPGWTREKSWPAVFMTDGGAASFAPMIDKMIETGEIPPIVVVSAWSSAYGVIEGTPPEGDLRSLEYIRNFRDNHDRFEGHMRFFAEELVRYAQAEYGVSTDRKERSVAGYSNGGVFALWAGLMHPEVFGNALAMSPGIADPAPEDLLAQPRARFLLSAGLYEAGFYSTASKVAAKLQAAGFDVTSRHLAAGHANDQWAIIVHDRLMDIYARP